MRFLCVGSLPETLYSHWKDEIYWRRLRHSFKGGFASCMSTDQFQNGNRKESHGSDTVDGGGQSANSGKTLHRVLYRRKCRVWLLALGLPLAVVLIIIGAGAPSNEFVNGVAITVGLIFSFWLGAPSQKVPTRFREEETAPGEQSQVRRNFDNPRRSLRDFSPRLMLLVIILLICMLYNIWVVMEP